MSDLTATNCGCNNVSTNSCGCGNNLIWIILLLSLFNNNGDCGCGNGISLFGGNGNGCGNNSCEWLIWILLISCFCGNGN